MKKKALYLLIFGLIAATVVGVLIGLWMLENRQKLKDTVVVLNGTTSKELEVNLVEFAPGDSQEYSIRLKAKTGTKYAVMMSFEETGIVTLAPYIDVEIKYDGETVAKGNLKDYLDGVEEKIEFTVNFAEKTQDIVVIYSMDINETEGQNTIADFDIHLLAELD